MHSSCDSGSLLLSVLLNNIQNVMNNKYTDISSIEYTYMKRQLSMSNTTWLAINYNA